MRGTGEHGGALAAACTAATHAPWPPIECPQKTTRPVSILAGLTPRASGKPAASFMCSSAASALSLPPSSQLCAPWRVGATIQKCSTPKVKSSEAEAAGGLNLKASALSRTGREVPCSVRMAGQPKRASHSSARSGRMIAAAETAPS